MENAEANKSTETKTTATPVAAPVEKGWLAKTADAIEDHPMTAMCVTFAGVSILSIAVCALCGGYSNNN